MRSRPTSVWAEMPWMMFIRKSAAPLKWTKRPPYVRAVILTIIACGEMVRPAKDAAKVLESKGISCRVLDMYCVKPIDKEAVVRAAKETKAIITIEEHTYVFGGLGSMVAQIVCQTEPKKVINLSLPDAPVITGKSQEVFDYYGLNAESLVNTVSGVDEGWRINI